MGFMKNAFKGGLVVTENALFVGIKLFDYIRLLKSYALLLFHTY